MIKEEQKMSVRIKDIRVICTAPEGINLVVVKIETNQPGLYGLGCATFAYRHLTVKHLIEEYMNLFWSDVRLKISRRPGS
jgi:hypothetical protein